LTNKAQDASQVVTDHNELKSVKIYGQMCRLVSSFNPDATELVDQFQQGKEILVISEESTTFDQELKNKD
jgi:hypothetical protein